MRELHTEKNYWKKFYKQFTDYQYVDMGCFDNYVGSHIKNIRVFFNYLNKELALGIGEFHKLFYVRRENIAIHPLLPEELNFLISNKEFEASLSYELQLVKDIFVFGCTVALRISDLIALQPSNIRQNNGDYYLIVRSVKTATDTMIKLPDYAITIVLKHQSIKRKTLLPQVNKQKLNENIRELLERAGLTQVINKRREKRGKVMEVYPEQRKKLGYFRFCDLASSHIMRRTAITSMLSLGMPETIVKKISGHAPGSKEFYKYVCWAQSYQDVETQKMFEKLKGIG